MWLCRVLDLSKDWKSMVGMLLAYEPIHWSKSSTHASPLANHSELFPYLTSRCQNAYLTWKIPLLASTNLSVPFRMLEEFFPGSSDALDLSPSKFAQPNYLPPIIKTWGSNDAWSHQPPESEIIDLISPDPTPAGSTRNPKDEDEWNVCTQMSVDREASQDTHESLSPGQELSWGLPSEKCEIPSPQQQISSNCRQTVAMERCTSHISNALNQIAGELSLLPEHELQKFDVESLADHAARAIRTHLSQRCSSLSSLQQLSTKK
ncbi:hypothetical protein DFH28DRAFT_255388 [Melampsora americana]|nr:hypothetical protein DFH28DRAFT_255388 [Melampsora americana]